MTNDLEYLELAAKAAGIELRFPYDPLTHEPVQYVPPRRTDTWENWNPITDDGDALRLAVKLLFRVKILEHKTEVMAAFSSTEIVELHNADPLAATRRAIVRAAAEIGRSMK